MPDQTPLQIALAEYRRWRDWAPTDETSQMIQLGAIGAASNIVGRLVMDSPVQREIEQEIDAALAEKGGQKP